MSPDALLSPQPSRLYSIVFSHVEMLEEGAYAVLGTDDDPNTTTAFLSCGCWK